MVVWRVLDEMLDFLNTNLGYQTCQILHRVCFNKKFGCSMKETDFLCVTQGSSKLKELTNFDGCYLKD